MGILTYGLAILSAPLIIWGSIHQVKRERAEEQVRALWKYIEKLESELEAELENED